MLFLCIRTNEKLKEKQRVWLNLSHEKHTAAGLQMDMQCICSVQSESLHNLKIALCILRIPRLYIIVAQSRDCICDSI